MFHLLLVIFPPLLVQYTNEAECPSLNYNYKCGRLAESSNYPMIFAGSETNKKYPWYVALTYNGEKPVQCGGTLITRRHVLTAAHCFEPDQDEEYWKNQYQIWIEVYEWLNNIKEDAIQRYACNVTLHPGYHKDNYLNPNISANNDIALIRLNKIPKFVNIMPICLPSFGFLEYPKNGTTIGYGLINKAGTSPSKIMETVIDIYAAERCKDVTNLLYIPKDDIICGKGWSGNVYIGDFGGPLQTFYDKYYDEKSPYTILGIASVSREEGDTYPMMIGFTSVFYHRNWIDDEIHKS
ncbi:hypothetical protein DMENIID0001_087200 [Sergentomyia squamirostris]